MFSGTLTNFLNQLEFINYSRHGISTVCSKTSDPINREIQDKNYCIRLKAFSAILFNMALRYIRRDRVFESDVSTSNCEAMMMVKNYYIKLKDFSSISLNMALRYISRDHVFDSEVSTSTSEAMIKVKNYYI